MDIGRFCFLSDQYYIDFDDKYLMQSKEAVDGGIHSRPCFFVFPDTETSKILCPDIITIHKILCEQISRLLAEDN